LPSVHLRACSFAHTAAVPVLDAVNLDLADSWVGVVGPNGAGKTTLLHLVAGVLTPTSGAVDVVAAIPPVLCRQEVAEPTPDVWAFAWDYDGRAARLRSRLALDPDDLDRWRSLSPGERKRWQIGVALGAEPEILLLDEPTNHLDRTARALLLDVLRDFRGLGVVVSHDRVLLDDLTTTTLRVARGGVEAWAGPYTEARERWDGADAELREAHGRARREERRMQRLLGDLRRDRAAAETAPRARRRNSPNEPDAREAGRKFAEQKAEKALANRVRAVNSRVVRAGIAVAGVASRGLDRELGGDIGVAHVSSGRRWLATITAAELRAGDAVVLRDVDVAVARGDHIHVPGPNGAGKTTLVAALVATAPSAGHLPQELDDAASARLLTDLRATAPDVRGQILGIVATLGVEPDRLLVTDRPSPGEARKLALAGLLASSHELIALDEPTNHLDLPSTERLEAAAAAFPGAVLLVTHDDRLAAATTDVTWRVEAGRVTVTRAAPDHPQ
jgi:ATPase subunit of ABC transporter with duplicated ATPase domains